MADLLSILALTALFIGCLLPIVNAYRLPSEYSPLEKVLYAPVYCVGRLLWRIEIVRGAEAKLSSGVTGAIIVANHRNSLDPFFIQLACSRRVHWMVAGEYFKNPVFGLVLRTFQAIPTNRSGADSASLKTAMRLAGEGRLVGMFPEGRINRSKSPLLKIRTGAGLVASKANCPLLPCWVEGAPRGWDVWSGWFTAARIKISIGLPIYLAVDETAKNTESSQPEGIAGDYLSNLNASDALTVSAMRESLQLGGFPQWPVQLVRSRAVATRP